jgi:hypothetical protein
MNTMKLGSQTASPINWIMSNNNTTPKVGQGMTRLFWTDRYAYEVLWVSKDAKRVIVKRYEEEYKDSYVVGIGDLVGEEMEIRYRHGAWRFQSYKGWEKMNVIFGVRSAYRDPSF